MFQMKDPNKKVESILPTKKSQRSERIPNPLGKEFHPIGKKVSSDWEKIPIRLGK